MVGTKYIRYECPRCGSTNVTPIGKRQVGSKSMCSYVCEGCGYQWGPVVYAVVG